MFSEMTTLLIIVEVGHVYLYVKNIFTRKNYENIEITHGEPSKKLKMCGLAYKQVNSNPLLLELCKNTQPHTQTALHIWKECYKLIVIEEKNIYMQGDLNDDLLKVDRLEQILKKINLYKLIKEPTRLTPRSKTLIDVMITKNRDTVMHAETSLSIADHHAVSCTINLRKKRMRPFQTNGRNNANYSHA